MPARCSFEIDSDVHYCAMMRIVSLSLVALSYAILSVYRPVAIAQPSNCCSNRCHFRNDVTNNNLSTAADENNPWDNWYEWAECRANDGTNTTAGNAPPKNASLVCENSNGWMNETGQYYTCCYLEKHLLSVAQLTASLVLGCFTLGFVVVLMLGILRSKEARRQPANAKLIFLFGPGVIFVAWEVVTAPLLFNCRVRESFSLADVWTGSFYGASSVLQNAVIAHDIYELLRSSKKCLRIKAMPLSTIYKRVSVVYLIAALSGTWITILFSDIIESWPPFSVGRTIASGLTMALIYLPPIFYVFYICIRVWKDKLLPLSGETRALAFYFLRIAIVFFAIWVPMLVFLFLYNNRFGYGQNMHNLTYFVYSAEIISVALALTKPDVLLAVKRLLCSGRGYQQWKARRITELSSEEVRRAENTMRVSAWDKPDDYGDNILREISWKNRASRRVDGDGVSNEGN